MCKPACRTSLHSPARCGCLMPEGRLISVSIHNMERITVACLAGLMEKGMS